MALSKVAQLAPGEGESREHGFDVRLENFEGPFDLLLSLIAKHKLDITEVALARVTDEFISQIKAAGPEWDLDQSSSFLVVAATLLDLKAARLLPAGDVEDAEDLALLEARDLLFARLMQYRAFKQVAGFLAARLSDEAQRYPRTAGPEDAFADLMPDVMLGVTLERFAALAAKAMTPTPVAEKPVVELAHIHAPVVSVAEQTAWVAARLSEAGELSFRALILDVPDRHTTVARFLSLLELFRQGLIAFEQAAPLAELTIRWIGGAESTTPTLAGFDGGSYD